MSWGGPQQQPNYGQGAYGQGQQRPAYGQPPAGQYGAPPGGQYGAPPGGQYGAPPGQHGAPQGQYGAPPGGQYGAPPAQHGAPPGQHGAPPGQHGVPPGQYGAPPGGQYGAPPGGQYGAPPAGQYGAPPRQAAPPQGQYGAPPAGQAYGAPPGHQPAGYAAPQGYGSAPPPAAGGGYGAQPPPGVSPEVFTWFQIGAGCSRELVLCFDGILLARKTCMNVDTDRSGKITATELQHALMNGNWSPFNAETCRLMIGMFDRDRNGTIDIQEFAALWKYIQDWKGCFDRFDTDRSGNIDANELGNAFRQFGYVLSPQFSQTVIRVFDRRRGGHSINFDDFIQSCVMLKTLTEKFRVKDTSQNGVIRINYEDFLEMVLDTTINK